MTGKVLICDTSDGGGDLYGNCPRPGHGNCPRPGHGKFLYYCKPCHQEWKARYPLTSAAISTFASGKGSKAAVAKARKQDEANLKEATS